MDPITPDHSKRILFVVAKPTTLDTGDFTARLDQEVASPPAKPSLSKVQGSTILFVVMTLSVLPFLADEEIMPKPSVKRIITQRRHLALATAIFLGFFDPTPDAQLTLEAVHTLHRALASTPMPCVSVPFGYVGLLPTTLGTPGGPLIVTFRPLLIIRTW